MNVWACEFCDILFPTKNECIRHEDTCIENPMNNIDEDLDEDSEHEIDTDETQQTNDSQDAAECGKNQGFRFV